jgi:hypothetical protein
MNETAERPLVAFRLHGVGEKEGTLFKSFLRLLDHRTHERWVQSQDNADVWVVPPDTPVRPPHPGVQLLALVLPIHADELETRLSRMGEVIRATRRRNAAAAASGAVRLVRWPPAALVGHPQRMRLATLMTGRAWTPMALCERSGLPAAFVQQFLDDLRVARLIADDHAPHHYQRASAPLPQVQPGLIGRIRERLGLHATHRS